MTEQNVKDEAKLIEGLAVKSLGDDTEVAAHAANVLAQEAHTLLSSPDPIYLGKLNQQFAADRHPGAAPESSSSHLLPTISIDDPREDKKVGGQQTLTVTRGDDVQHYYANGSVGVSYGDKLGPALLRHEIGSY